MEVKSEVGESGAEALQEAGHVVVQDDGGSGDAELRLGGYADGSLYGIKLCEERFDKAIQLGAGGGEEEWPALE